MIVVDVDGYPLGLPQSKRKIMSFWPLEYCQEITYTLGEEEGRPKIILSKEYQDLESHPRQEEPDPI